MYLQWTPEFTEVWSGSNLLENQWSWWNGKTSNPSGMGKLAILLELCSIRTSFFWKVLFSKFATSRNHVFSSWQNLLRSLNLIRVPKRCQVINTSYTYNCECSISKILPLNLKSVSSGSVFGVIMQHENVLQLHLRSLTSSNWASGNHWYLTGSPCLTGQPHGLENGKTSTDSSCWNY